MSGTGDWNDPPESPGIIEQLSSYLRSLPPRAMTHFAEEGRRLRDDGMKEAARRTYGVGPLVDAKDAFSEGRYPAALGNVALSALDLAAPITSPATATADALAHAWRAGTAARPAQVAEALAALITKRMKAAGPAAEKRVAAAERSVPQPELPPGARYPDEAQRMLDVIDRRWPGNLMAGVGTTAGATGIPGIMMDDAKDRAQEYIDPAVAQYHTMRDEMARESEQNAIPLRGDAEAHPNVAHYQHLQGEAQHRRNINAADAGLEMAGGIGASAALPKATQWAARNMSGALFGLGADLASHGPPGMALGIPVMAAGALPFAVPAGLGYGAYKAAYDIPEHASAALDAHAKAKLIGKILQNYQDPNMKLTADGDY